MRVNNRHSSASEFVRKPYRSEVGKTTDSTSGANGDGRQKKVDKPVNGSKRDILVLSRVFLLKLGVVHLRRDPCQLTHVGASQLDAADVGRSLGDFYNQVAVDVDAPRKCREIVQNTLHC